MDALIPELLRYGWQGLVVAIMLGLARLIWPAVAGMLPKWLTARRMREDRLLKALQTATQALTEAAAASEAVRQELARLGQKTDEMGAHVHYIAAQLELGRPPRHRRPANGKTTSG